MSSLTNTHFDPVSILDTVIPSLQAVITHHFLLTPDCDNVSRSVKGKELFAAVADAKFVNVAGRGILTVVGVDDFNVWAFFRRFSFFCHLVSPSVLGCRCTP